MKCCEHCFCDSEITKMIASENSIGDCDFCGAKDVHVIEIDSESEIVNLVSDIFNLYDDSEDGRSLKVHVLDDWNIFNKENERIDDLLNTLLQFSGDRADCNRKVDLPKRYDLDYGILRGHTWEEFSDDIKRVNRFHNDYFNKEGLNQFMSYVKESIAKDTTYYRARICSSKIGYDTKDMGMPPVGKRRAGRINPEGIGVLYLASNFETALNEVRASSFDIITIGTFKLKKNISVIDLSKLEKISPFLDTGIPERLSANLSIFREISREISKPLRRNDSVLEYLPTQYITEYIRSQGFAGVMYKSTMRTGGTNLALFDEKMAECISVEDVEIKKIKYDYERIVKE